MQYQLTLPLDLSSVTDWYCTPSRMPALLVVMAGLGEM
jgi:hypothetical protein